MFDKLVLQENGLIHKLSFPLQNRFVMMLIDGMILVIWSLILFKVRNGSFDISEKYQFLIIILVLVSINIFSALDLYTVQKGHRLDSDISKLAIGHLIALFVVALLTFFTKSGENFSRLWLGSTVLVSFMTMGAYRALLWHITRRLHQAGINQTRVVIVGAEQLGEIACDTMLDERWAGYKPVAFFSDRKEQNFSYRSIKLAGKLDDLLSYIEKQRSSGKVIHEVWIALPLDEAPKIEKIHQKLRNTAVKTYLVPNMLGLNLANYQLDEAAGMPILDLSATSLKHNKAVIKRIEDLLLASLMLILLSPVFLIVATLIKLDSKGPIFFKQNRYGLDGKEIKVWKFRSMTTTENDDIVVQAKKNDSRVTRVGKFIRRYSIDELPQLFNVLNGSMSLIGPRPHASAHNEFYRDKIEGYMSRHIIPPGMTGWAQVNGCRGETDTIKKMERRIRYDLEYIQHWSIFLDFRILLKTLLEVFRGKNAY